MFNYAAYLTVLALGLVIANMIANKKVGLIASILSLLCLVMLIASFIPALQSVYDAIDTTGNYVYFFVFSIISLVAALANLIYYSYKRKNINKLFEVAATFDSDKVIAVVSKKGKLLKASSKLENIIDKFDAAPNEYGLSVTKIKAGDKEYSSKLLANFKNILKGIVLTQKEKELVFVYSNGLTIQMRVGIQDVKINDKVYGYALFDQNIIASDDYKEAVDKASKKNTFIYLDMLDSDIAYFDNVVGKYILTNHFYASLGLNLQDELINSLSKDDLAKYIHKDDISVYRLTKAVKGKVLKIYYRIQLINDYEWFEESLFIDGNNNEYRVLRRVDAMIASKVRYGNYKAFVKQLEDLCNNQTGFGIIMLNLYSLPKITANIGKQMSDLVVSNYFNKIINSVLKGACSVYKISIIEYALVVNDIQLLNVIKRDLVDNSSFLTSSEISLNNLNVTVEAEVGVVSSDEVENVNPKDMARIAFDMLKQASDPAYPKNYSIYNKTAPVNLDYSLADLGIDLDEDLSVYDDTEENEN